MTRYSNSQFYVEEQYSEMIQQFVDAVFYFADCEPLSVFNSWKKLHDNLFVPNYVTDLFPINLITCKMYLSI